MAKRQSPPTQRQLDILKMLGELFDAKITRRIDGSRFYHLVAAPTGDKEIILDALTLQEVTALFKRGWVQDRESGSDGNPRYGAEFIITEAGGDLLEAAHG